jgi:biotin carboxyl carrier protein
MHRSLQAPGSLVAVTASKVPETAFALVCVLSGCAAPAAGPPPPSQPAVVAVPTPSAGAPASPPPGEVWVAADRLATIELTTPRRPADVALAVARARVAIDEAHAMHVRCARSGTVRSIAAVAGAHVRSGDELLVLDVNDARGPAVAAAAARLAAASRARARVEELWSMRAASTSDREAAAADHERAARALFDARRASRTGTARVSPLSGQDGEVVRVLVQPGQQVLGEQDDHAFATELVVVADPAYVVVVADDVPRGVRAGAHASFRADGLPDVVFECNVATSTADPALRCPLPDPTRRLRPGTHGRLLLTVADAPGLAIPRAALVRDGAAVLVRGAAAPDGRVRFVETPVSVAFDGGRDAPVVTVTGLTGDESLLADASQASALPSHRFVWAGPTDEMVFASSEGVNVLVDVAVTVRVDSPQALASSLGAHDVADAAPVVRTAVREALFLEGSRRTILDVILRPSELVAAATAECRRRLADRGLGVVSVEILGDMRIPDEIRRALERARAVAP